MSFLGQGCREQVLGYLFSIQDTLFFFFNTCLQLYTLLNYISRLESAAINIKWHYQYVLVHRYII